MADKSDKPTGISPFLNALLEAERSFYVSGNRVHFTRGQEHVSFDITKLDPYDIAHDLVAKILVVNAMAGLSKKLKREPSYEELADEADENAFGFGQEIAQRALHMGASDFRAVAQDLFPGLAKEAPKDIEESLTEGFHVPDDELKMGRIVRWYDDSQDRLMFGTIVNVSATSVQVSDGKFKTDKTYTVKPDYIVRVSEEHPKTKKVKVVWSRTL